MGKGNSKQDESHGHGGHRERVKDTYMESGLDGFHDHQIVEFILFYALPMRDTNKLAHEIMDEFGSLEHLFNASPTEIMNRCKVTRNAAILLTLPLSLYTRYLKSKNESNNILDTSGKVGSYAISLYPNKKYECFYVLCLNNRRKLIQTVKISEGTINEAAVYVRNIIEAVITYNATGIILIHNHPSGSKEPSGDDIESTKKVANALATINVDVIDHIIVAGEEYVSFAELRLLRFR